MKYFLTLLLVSILCISLTACGFLQIGNEKNNEFSASNSPAKDKPSDESMPQESPKNRYRNLDLFIAEYNKYATTPMSNPIEIDIQSDEYYRTEFRLNAFKNAPAYIVSTGNNTIELINSNYEGMFGSDLRIYALVNSLSAVTDIFESFCKAVDTDITQEDFNEFYRFYSLDSGDCRVVIGGITGRVIESNGKYDIMLEITPDFFN